MARRYSGPPVQGAAVTRKPTKPECPRHSVPMSFHTDSMVWRCDLTDCNMVAYPKEDVDAGKGKPKVGRGILEVVKSGKSWYLRSSDDNVMVEVTGHLAEADMQSDGRGGTSILLTLRLNNIMELPE